MSEKSRLLKNTGLIAIGNFGAKMISFLLLPMYTSILTTSEYGSYDFIVAVSAFLLPVATISMHEAMFRFIIDTGNVGEEFKKVVSNALVTVILGITTLGVVMLFLSGINVGSDLIYVWFYVAASALYVFANNMLRGLGRIKEYAIISSCKNILQLVFNVLVVAVLRWGMQGLLFSLCISEILAFVVVVYISKLWKYVGGKYVSKEKIKEMLKYSLPLIPNTLCAQTINLSSRLIISGVMGTSANGIYSVSYKFPNMVETVYHYFYTAWSESASRVFSKGKEDAVKYYQSLYDLLDNMMYSVILLMISGMPIMFRIFIRGEYVQGFKYVPLLLFAMYFDSLAKFYSGIFTALKKTKAMATSTIAAAIVNVVVNLLLIRSWGLYAAACSTLLADIVLVVSRNRLLSMDVIIKSQYKKNVIKIAMAILVLILYSYDNWYKTALSLGIVSVYSIRVNFGVIRSAKDILKQKFIK